jgi:hypothetical protein
LSRPLPVFRTPSHMYSADAFAAPDEESPRERASSFLGQGRAPAAWLACPVRRGR